MTFTKYFAKNVSEGIIISDNTSDITFAVGHNLPTDTSAGVYLISIEDEIVEVETLAEDVTGNLIASVLRAREDTTFAVHAADVTGKLLFTAGAMNQVSDAIVDMKNTIIAITMSDEDVETAYNNRVSVVDQTGAELGTDTTVYRWTPERLTQAINAKIPVTTVNTYTGDVVLNSDDISDTTSTQKYATAAEKTKLGHISVTQAVDLDALESDTETNNAKVTNANHTGDVTGSSGLIIVPTAISGKTEVTPATGDYVLLWDATDSLLKKGLVNNFINASGLVTTDSTSSLTNKTVQSRVVNATVDSTSINYNADNGDIFNATLIGNTVLKNPTGTLYDGQKIMVRVRTGTGSFALTYDTLYRFSTDVPQPTIPTAATKLVYLLFIYNSTDLRLDLLSANQGF